jgi:putative DNA primase/helicase
MSTTNETPESSDPDAKARAASKKSASPATPEPAQPLNFIAFGLERKSAEKRGGSVEPEVLAEKPRKPQKPKSASALDIPESVQERFIHLGNKFYFPDGADAFVRNGNRLTTRSENAVVIQSMVAIAHHENGGKGAIAVSGTELFRKEAWFAARLVGLEVNGYKPSAIEEERLVRAVARRQAAAKEEGGPAAPRPDRTQSPAGTQPAKEEPAAPALGARPFTEGELLVGRLVDHGPARYQHKPNQQMSYYVRIETPQGDREIWGVDLERAVRQSLTTPGIGDEVGLRAVGRDPVTVRNGKGAGDPVHTHRNQWILERKEFLDRRGEMASLMRDPAVSDAEATRRYPELDGSYRQLQMGRDLASDQYASKLHREQFVEHLRGYIARNIEYGKPLEPVAQRAWQAKTPEPEKTQDREYVPTR